MARSEKPINNFTDLFDKIKQAKPAERLGLVLRHWDKITSPNDITSLLLPSFEGLDTTTLMLNSELKDKISINNVYKIFRSFRQFYEMSEMVLFETFGNTLNEALGKNLSVTEVKDLVKAMVNPDLITAIVCSYEDKIEDGESLSNILSLLPEERRLDFAVHNQDKVLDGYQLRRMLYALPKKNRLDFATHHQDKILNAEQLRCVLYALPKENRLAFAERHQDKITNIQDFDHVIAMIYEPTSAEKQRLAEHCCPTVCLAYLARENPAALLAQENPTTTPEPGPLSLNGSIGHDDKTTDPTAPTDPEPEAASTAHRPR